MQHPLRDGICLLALLVIRQSIIFLRQTTFYLCFTILILYTKICKCRHHYVRYATEDFHKITAILLAVSTKMLQLMSLHYQTLLLLLLLLSTALIFTEIKKITHIIMQTNETNGMLTIENWHRCKFNESFTDDDVRLFLFDRFVQRIERVIFQQYCHHLNMAKNIMNVWTSGSSVAFKVWHKIQSMLCWQYCYLRSFAKEFSQCNAVEWFIILSSIVISQITYRQHMPFVWFACK